MLLFLASQMFCIRVLSVRTLLWGILIHDYPKGEFLCWLHFIALEEWNVWTFSLQLFETRILGSLSKCECVNLLATTFLMSVFRSALTGCFPQGYLSRNFFSCDKSWRPHSVAVGMDRTLERKAHWMFCGCLQNVEWEEELRALSEIYWWCEMMSQDKWSRRINLQPSITVQMD